MPSIAMANENTALANQALVLQIMDSATTYGIVRTPFSHEIDPFAKPFVHSLPTLLTMSVSLNIVGRFLFHRHPKLWYAVDAVEGFAVISNEELLKQYTNYYNSQKEQGEKVTSK